MLNDQHQPAEPLAVVSLAYVLDFFRHMLDINLCETPFPQQPRRLGGPPNKVFVVELGGGAD
jgi:hypothetical protein